MNRTDVESSNLLSVGYDQATATLEIAFHSGSVYQYTNVPLEIYQELMQASSKGQYFNHEIKGGYAYRKVGRAGRRG